MIGWDNYEEYMMMHADGELQPAEEQELMEFVAAHPELKAELKAYGLARLSPDETVIYSDKDSLLRSEPSKRTIAFPQWRRYAIAAGVALLLCFSFYRYREINKNTNSIAVTNTPATITPKNVQPVVDTSTAVVPKDVQAPKTDIAVITPPRKIAPATTHKQQKMVPVVREEKQEQERDVAIVRDTVVPIKPVVPVDAPPQIVKKEPPVSHVDTPVAAPVLPIAEVQNDGKTKKKSFIDRLPIDESNKHQLRKIFRITKGTYAGVSKVKQELDNGEITVRVEDNKLRISF
jgi:hypothetical protein